MHDEARLNCHVCVFSTKQIQKKLLSCGISIEMGGVRGSFFILFLKSCFQPFTMTTNFTYFTDCLKGSAVTIINSNSIFFKTYCMNQKNSFTVRMVILYCNCSKLFIEFRAVYQTMKLLSLWWKLKEIEGNFC